VLLTSEIAAASGGCISESDRVRARQLGHRTRGCSRLDR
jgi:hypothetical protein